MQRYAYDGGRSEINVLYDADLGSCIADGITKEMYAKIVKTQAGSLCGGGWLR